jgi:hypothetical protein
MDSTGLVDPSEPVTTNRRDTANSDVPVACTSTCSPTGSSPAGYRRVGEPASIRATIPSASRSVPANAW